MRYVMEFSETVTAALPVSVADLNSRLLDASAVDMASTRATFALNCTHLRILMLCVEESQIKELDISASVQREINMFFCSLKELNQHIDACEFNYATCTLVSERLAQGRAIVNLLSHIIYRFFF